MASSPSPCKRSQPQKSKGFLRVRGLLEVGSWKLGVRLAGSAREPRSPSELTTPSPRNPEPPTTNSQLGPGFPDQHGEYLDEFLALSSQIAPSRIELGVDTQFEQIKPKTRLTSFLEADLQPHQPISLTERIVGFKEVCRNGSRRPHELPTIFATHISRSYSSEKFANLQGKGSCSQFQIKWLLLHNPINAADKWQRPSGERSI